MSELNPGPDLDRLVAEKVMGFSFASSRTALMYPKDGERYGSHFIEEGGVVVQATMGSYPDFVGTERWRPSTSIEHAWEVVEKMHALGHGMIVFKSKNKWVCHYKIGETDVMHYRGWIYDLTDGTGVGETAPHAICLAALMALGAIKGGV